MYHIKFPFRLVVVVIRLMRISLNETRILRYQTSKKRLRGADKIFETDHGPQSFFRQTPQWVLNTGNLCFALTNQTCGTAHVVQRKISLIARAEQRSASEHHI